MLSYILIVPLLLVILRAQEEYAICSETYTAKYEDISAEEGEPLLDVGMSMHVTTVASL